MKAWKSQSENFERTLAKYYTPSHLITNTFEIVRDIGEGEAYTECDGVPRWKWKSSPRAKITEMATVLTTAHNSGRAEKSQWDKFFEYNPVPCDWDGHREDCLDAEDGGVICEKLPEPWQSSGETYDECYFQMMGEIQLMYWPESLTSRDICASDGVGTASTLPSDPNQHPVVTVSAITFPGDGIFLRQRVGVITDVTNETDMKSFTYTQLPSRGPLSPSVLTGPFYFTSPTIYIAHRPIEVITSIFEDRTTRANLTYYPTRGTTQVLPAGIMTVKSDDIFAYKIHAVSRDGQKLPGTEYAQMVAKGNFTMLGRPRSTTMPFDFGHLQDPVPASAYFDGRLADCFGQQTHCATITDGSYRPLLAIRRRVFRSMVGAFMDCMDTELEDPPVALRPISVPEEPESPAEAPIPFITPLASGAHLTGQGEMPAAQPAHAANSPWVQATGSPMPYSDAVRDGRISNDNGEETSHHDYQMRPDGRADGIGKGEVAQNGRGPAPGPRGGSFLDPDSAGEDAGNPPRSSGRTHKPGKGSADRERDDMRADFSDPDSAGENASNSPRSSGRTHKPGKESADRERDDVRADNAQAERKGQQTDAYNDRPSTWRKDQSGVAGGQQSDPSGRENDDTDETAGENADHTENIRKKGESRKKMSNASRASASLRSWLLWHAVSFLMYLSR
jgi:hypothetical protein